MQDFKNETGGALLRQKATLPQPAEFYNNRETRLDAPNRTAVPLPEIHGIFRSRTISVLSLKFPCHPLFEILHLSAGGCRSDESRKPKPYFKYLSWRAGVRRRWLGTICRKGLKGWDTAVISKRMPGRKRIVRFENVFSCIPFLLRLSQIVEPEPEPHPRPPRIRLKINYGFRTLFFIGRLPDKSRFTPRCRTLRSV